MTVKEVAEKNPDAIIDIMASIGMTRLPAKQILTDAFVTMYPGCPGYGITFEMEYLMCLKVSREIKKGDTIYLLTD